MGSAAAAAGIAAVGSSVIQAKAAGKAADQQSAAAGAAGALQREQFEATQERLDPYMQGGVEAYQQQQAMSGALGPQAQEQAYADFRESPGVQFQREQGESAINRQAAATGGFGGATRLKELSRFNQGLAEQSINNRFNQLGAITGVGLGAAQSLGSFGAQAAGAQGQALTQSGQAQAQGTLGQANAWSSGLGSLAGIYGGSGGFGGGGGQ